MAKRYHNEKDDITDEPYKGPSVAAAAAGEGFVAHWVLAGIGLITGVALTFIFRDTAKRSVSKMQETASKWINDASGVKTFMAQVKKSSGNFIHALFGKGEGQLNNLRESLANCIDPKEAAKLERHFVYQEHGFGHWLLDHTIGLIPGVRGLFRNISSETSTAITIGGLLGALGFFGAPILWGKHGADKATDGKRQFERAKEEILETRAQYEALREKYIDARLELEDLKTAQAVAQGSLKVAQDDTPTMHDKTAVSSITTASPTTPQVDSPTEPTAPKIEEPVIGPAKTTGRTLGEIKGGKAWTAAMADRAAAAADQQHDAALA